MIAAPPDESCYSTYAESEPIGLLRAAFRRHHFVAHSHQTFALGVIESGAAVTEYRGSRHIVPAGAVISLNPGEVHTGAPLSSVDGWRYRMMYLETSLLLRIATAWAGKTVAHIELPAPSFADPEVARALLRLHQVLERGPPSLRGQSILHEALGLLIQRYGGVQGDRTQCGPEPAAIATIKEFLAAHLKDGVQIAQLADLVEMSPFHLIRLFRRHAGLPPYAWFEQLRVARAMELLGVGTPMADVVLATGFSDQSHLVRQFKRIVGVPPGKYARGMALGRGSLTPPTLHRPAVTPTSA